MKSRNVAEFMKNAMGAVFLLAGAFFVCSTLLSMRAVFADPIAPTIDSAATVQSARAGNTTTSRTSPRNTTRNSASRSNVSRTTTGAAATTGTTASRATASRAVTSRATSNATSRAVASRAGGATNTSRGVATRSTTGASRTTTNRNVIARNGANTARVSVSGSAIRGSKAATTTYTYLQNKLYTGTYSNIIDSTTGLISADAYNNCMESYYTCMDEICTARNAAQRRCACAGRVKAFADAELKLEQANEELIKVSGELALLIANKGKDVSYAFQLTEAEQVMNCVSWQEMSNKYGTNSSEAQEWCYNHSIFDGNGNGLKPCGKPSYCSSAGNKFGFNVDDLNGSSSDILASLQSWAEAKANTLTILNDDNDSLFDAFTNLSDVVSGMAGISNSIASTDNLKDSLAETWGYELFEYAHNNVCARVLDSCFNGIYEACGTPPSGTYCGNGASQCPYNYNSKVSVSNSGTYELNFVTPNSGYSQSNSATCYGYTTSTGDPYSSLRRPVADARRSILQKYALDANADCDAYGEQLRTTAQNIGYQKVAAQQALQQKRLEFANEERETVLAEAITAGTNFNECISELAECYDTQESANPSWSRSRVRTYCAQIANAPSCYETMICNPSNAQFRAIIDKADSAQCNNSSDYTLNTCRNVVTLNDILNGTGTDAKECANDASNCNSAAMREHCLQQSGVKETIREWCPSGQEWTGTSCVKITE